MILMHAVYASAMIHESGVADSTMRPSWPRYKIELAGMILIFRCTEYTPGPSYKKAEQLNLNGHMALSASAHFVIDLANLFRMYGPHVGLDKPREIYHPAQKLYVSAGICYRPGYRILYLGQPK